MMPIIPILTFVIRTNFACIVATDSTGADYSSSKMVSWTNSPVRLTWSDTNGYDITNYTVYVVNSLHKVRTFAVGTNTVFSYPPPQKPVTNIYTFTGSITLTNPVDGPRFFMLCESSDLRNWKPVTTANNTVRKEQ